LLDDGRMHRKNALDTLPERYLADREGAAHAAPPQIDNHALEDLDALFVAFLDPDVHADRIASLHPRPFDQLPLFDDFDGAHVTHSLPSLPDRAPVRARATSLVLPRRA